jgi:hypothetical protein
VYLPGGKKLGPVASGSVGTVYTVFATAFVLQLKTYFTLYYIYELAVLTIVPSGKFIFHMKV